MKKMLQSREGKQVLALACFFCVAGLYFAARFGLIPFVKSWRECSEEIKSLEALKETVEATFQREDQVTEALSLIVSRLDEAARIHIPPPANALSWATQRVYRHARSVGVEIQWIEETAVPGHFAVEEGSEPAAFIPYRARIAATGSYALILRFVASIEKGNPYVCISDVSIAGQAQDVETHHITLIIEWPTWIDAKRAVRQRRRGSDDHAYRTTHHTYACACSV